MTKWRAKSTLQNEVVETLEGMESGTHAILVYDSPENKRDILFSHLKAGERRENLVYVCADESPDQIAYEMATHGMDVNRLSDDGLLTVSRYDQVYIVNGRVDVEGVIGHFSRLAMESRERGLDGVRASAEMSCFFKLGMVDELVRYEHALHRRLAFPAKGICAYDVVAMENSGRLDVLMSIIRAHGLVILSGPSGNAVLESKQVKKAAIENTLQITV